LKHHTAFSDLEINPIQYNLHDATSLGTDGTAQVPSDLGQEWIRTVLGQAGASPMLDQAKKSYEKIINLIG
jgi:hypothetical protein